MAFIERLRRQARLDQSELAAVQAACSTPRHIVKRSDILDPGEGADGLHVLTDGWASRYHQLADGRRQCSALLLAGDIVDLDRLLLPTVEFGVQALTPCAVVFLPFASLRPLIDSSPRIRDAFWWLMATENAMANERAVSLGRRTARQRLAHLICETAARLASERDRSDPAFELPLTQQDLADALGISAVHVNRSLQGLRADGAISSRTGGLKISDWKVLCRAGGFRDDYLHLEGLRPVPPALTAVDFSPARPSASTNTAVFSDLAAALARREWELREVNHRLANSLQIAASFVDGEGRRIADPTAKAVLEATAGRLQAVGELHKYMYAHSESLEVDLKEFLHQLCPIIAKSTGLGCFIRSESMRVSAEMAQQLAIVINELAINAAKHAFAPHEPGVITIKAKQIDGHLVLIVSDNGRGLGNDFDPAATGRLGMTIITAIVRQLRGTLEAETAGGARFVLKAPVT